MAKKREQVSLMSGDLIRRHAIIYDDGSTSTREEINYLIVTRVDKKVLEGWSDLRDPQPGEPSNRVAFADFIGDPEQADIIISPSLTKGRASQSRRYNFLANAFMIGPDETITKVTYTRVGHKINFVV